MPAPKIQFFAHPALIGQDLRMRHETRVKVGGATLVHAQHVKTRQTLGAAAVHSQVEARVEQLRPVVGSRLKTNKQRRTIEMC